MSVNGSAPATPLTSVRFDNAPSDSRHPVLPSPPPPMSDLEEKRSRPSVSRTGPTMRCSEASSKSLAADGVKRIARSLRREGTSDAVKT